MVNMLCISQSPLAQHPKVCGTGMKNKHTAWKYICGIAHKHDGLGHINPSTVAHISGSLNKMMGNKSKSKK